MEKLDAVRDTNTLRVYSRLWLCFRDWVERESIVGVSRDSELPLLPSIVPTPVSRQPACSSTRSFPLGSRPHPSHKDVPHYRKHRHPSRWSAARSRLYARSRIQSNSSTRVTTSSASPRNHMRPRKYKRRTMPFRTRRSFPSFSWSKKKNMIGNRDEKSPIKPWTSDRAFYIIHSDRSKLSSFLFSGNGLGKSEVNYRRVCVLVGRIEIKHGCVIILTMWCNMM